MKFNFSVDMINDDPEEGDLQDEILERATEAFMEQVLGPTYDDDSMSSRLIEMIDNRIDEICNKDFKDKVCNILVERLANKIEKTKQYKEAIKDSEIYSDNQIKNGLRDTVAQLVKSEMKKVFNT